LWEPAEEDTPGRASDALASADLPSEDFVSEDLASAFAFDAIGFFVALELLVLLGRSDLFVPTSYLFFSSTVLPHRLARAGRKRRWGWQGRINGSAESRAQDRDALRTVEKSARYAAQATARPAAREPLVDFRSAAAAIL
jgi:hypothetical protein